MSIYLYGASVQGIQGFIFETNKLKEIVGASELVEEICTDLFLDLIDETKVKKILTAAGNIRLSADHKEYFKDLVLKFPKKVQDFASGITISQAIVESKDDDINGKDFDLLEKKLQIQRNIGSRPLEITGCAIRRSNRTGKSAVSYDKSDGQRLIDLGSEQKINKESNLLVEKLIKDSKDVEINREKYDFPKDMSKIIHNECKWLAVIHADGNNLGQMIRELPRNGNKSQLDVYKEFSSNLEIATCKAAKCAFKQAIIDKIGSDNIKTNKGWFPVRPILLGGDDLTLICRADLAIEFVSTYLNAFEDQTEKVFEGKKITACAGISFVKESYPFHYAIHLADELCAAAKTKSKDICKKQNHDEVPSSLAFHKVHASYIDSYNDIKENILYAKESDVHFDYGPYAINNDIDSMPPLKELLDKVKEFELMKQDTKASPKSGLRRWLSELSNNKESANQLLARLNVIHSDQMDKLGLVNPVNENKKTIVFDLLSILSLKGGE